MAVIEYQCQKCGLQQEKLFRKEVPDTVECPDCHSAAPRQLSDFGFRFADGKVPGNTGVYSLDTDVDKRVGRDAASRWEVVKDRNSAKQKAKWGHGDSEVTLGLSNEGEYVPLTEGQVETRKALHETHRDAHQDGSVSDLNSKELTSESSKSLRKVE